MHEAKIAKTDTGLQPADDGWWILNAADIGWFTVPGNGIWSSFEAPEMRSPLLGIGIHILQPGEVPGFYHSESNQEGFLVLSGECVALVEGEERRMRQWDYLHCPPGTAHITIGAGDGPCAILMVGTRAPDDTTQYIADPVAARHGASVREDTDSSRVAYDGRPPIEPARSPWPLE
jgi:uncharacterized cupin superfamily protein